MNSHFMFYVLAVLCCFFLMTGFFLFEELLTQFMGPSVTYYRPVTVILYLHVLVVTFYPKESIQFLISIFRKIWKK